MNNVAEYRSHKLASLDAEYNIALAAAVRHKPQNFAVGTFIESGKIYRRVETAEQYAQRTVAKMMETIRTRGLGGIQSPSSSVGLKNACKALGIKATYDALETYLTTD